MGLRSPQMQKAVPWASQPSAHEHRHRHSGLLHTDAMRGVSCWLLHSSLTPSLTGRSAADAHLLDSLRGRSLGYPAALGVVDHVLRTGATRRPVSLGRRGNGKKMHHWPCEAERAAPSSRRYPCESSRSWHCAEARRDVSAVKTSGETTLVCPWRLPPPPGQHCQRTSPPPSHPCSVPWKWLAISCIVCAAVPPPALRKYACGAVAAGCDRGTRAHQPSRP